MKILTQDELEAMLAPLTTQETEEMIYLAVTPKQHKALVLAVRGAIGLRSLESEREYLRGVLRTLTPEEAPATKPKCKKTKRRSSAKS